MWCTSHNCCCFLLVLRIYKAEQVKSFVLLLTHPLMHTCTHLQIHPSLPAVLVAPVSIDTGGNGRKRDTKRQPQRANGSSWYHEFTTTSFSSYSLHLHIFLHKSYIYLSAHASFFSIVSIYHSLPLSIHQDLVQSRSTRHQPFIQSVLLFLNLLPYPDPTLYHERLHTY